MGLRGARYALVVAAVTVLGACGLFAKTPQGPAADVARQAASVIAPNADVVDRPLEDLLAKLDLEKTYGTRAAEILDQVRKSRASANAKVTSGTTGPRLASVMRSVGAFSVPLFAQQFADSLDPLTKGGGAQQLPSNPFNSQESGPTSFTTTTLAITESFSASGSKVTGTVKWAYATITIETATGATLLHLDDARTLVGTIDVCPDANGNAASSLDVTTDIKAQTGATSTTRSSKGTSTFTGKVNDQASLTSVTQQQRVETSWQSTSGDGGYNSDMTATWTANAQGGFLSGLDGGSIGGSLAQRGAATAAEAASAAGWDLVLDGLALDAAYQKAQDLWRHGRCVIVAAYGAETPIEVTQQDTPQHDESVDQGTDTKFGVQLKHRFGGGAVSAPTTADLSGDKKLSPNRLDGSGGELTYTAPDDKDKKATARLRSVSKRGIGTLVLEFHTGGPLILTITGTLKSDSAFAGIGASRINNTVTIGPLEFKPFVGGMYQATGTWTANISSDTNAGGATNSCTGTEGGTISMTARLDTRDGKKVWVVDPQDADSEGQGKEDCTNSLGGTTIRGVTLPTTVTYDSTGDTAELFLGLLKEIVIPQSGGTVSVSGSRATFTASGSAKGATSK